jgi:hypothetical protein
MNMKKHIKKPIFQIAVRGGLLILFLTLTDPYRLPLPLLMVPFLLMTALIYKIVGVVVRPLVRSDKRTTYLATVTTSLFMLVLLLQTIRQLSLKDFLIVGALFLGLTFYIRRIDL